MVEISDRHETPTWCTLRIEPITPLGHVAPLTTHVPDDHLAAGIGLPHEIGSAIAIEIRERHNTPSSFTYCIEPIECLNHIPVRPAHVPHDDLARRVGLPNEIGL